MGEGEELVQSMVTQMLDKGTQLRDRFEIADILENKGAQISFSSQGLRVGFSGHALTEDVPETLRVMAESLKIPLLSEEELVKVKMNTETAVQQFRDSTSAQSTGALKRKLFGTAHPLYFPSPDETMERLQQVDIERVRKYHTLHFGARDMLLVFVGDLETGRILDTLREVFDGWPAGTVEPSFTANALPLNPGQTCVPMPDKQNLDVRFGHALFLRRSDKDYMPLNVAISILGGNFSSRLMQKIREEMGLTYGIYARMGGISLYHDGYVGAGITLSQENLVQGMESTLREVHRFVEEGPSEEELEVEKTTICGAYKVGMGTTTGLASVLYQQAVQGFDVSYLEGFTAEVEGVTTAGIRDAVQRHLKPDMFHTTIAGTLPSLLFGDDKDHESIAQQAGEKTSVDG